MICSSCGADNSAGARFCNDCGTSFAAGCPNCGAVNKPGARFCNECGTALGNGAATSGAATRPTAGSVAAPVAERRLVTILFADMVGFTPFAEERDAEEVRDTLSRYFDMCADVIGRYGGTVELFIGDAVMAVWGAPVAFEDDAERAVRAALELVAAVPALGPGAQARAGVLTGEAAVTLGATNQGMVAGDLVNTAARLQSVAPPGTVLVGEATMRATSGSVIFEEAGEQLLKGKQSPVAAWRAARVVAERGGRNRSEALEAPFVGREDELRLLKDLFHATGREKRIRLVSLMGPAGIGKSRLAWEFLKYVDGLVETTYWHDGRSPAYGEGITFWALGEMIRGRSGLTESDDEGTTRTKVAETVRQWVTDPEEIEWVEKALLTLLGIESGMASEQLFGAWRTFFERIAQVGTVTLVFEDVHHADSGLLDFIDHMLDWSRGLPIYIITLARPDLLDRRPGWGAGKRNFTSQYIEPLAEPQMRELLAGLVPGLPEAAVTTIVGRADGIPLYAVETVRSLVADGRLREQDGVYVPLGDLTTLAVPETLTALISSRLDALEPADRSLVHDAAVLGQSFSAEALGAISGVAADELTPRLNALVRREMLTRQVDVRSAEVGQYAFVQGLIREVAYNTLSKKDRKSRHLAAARYFDQLGSDELASVLASHYLAAHENAAEGPEQDTLAAQARVALRAAADRAASLGGYDQAVAFLQQALTVTTQSGDRGDLLERASDFASTASHHALAIDLARQAIAVREEAGDRVGAARATSLMGWNQLNGRYDRDGRDTLEAALVKYEDLEEPVVLAELKTNLARAYNQFERMGADARALALVDEALTVAEHGNHPMLLVRALLSKGAVLGTAGRLREAIALFRAGEEIAREHGLTVEVLGALTVRGYYLGEVDNDQAFKCFLDGLALARRVGHRQLEREFVNNVGYSSFLVGDWDTGLAELEGVLTQDLEPTGRIWLMSNALIIRANRGEDITDALAELEQLTRQVDDPHVLTAPHDTLGNHAQAQGRFEDAQRHWLYISENWASQAPASYYQAARPALWSGDTDAVRKHSADLDATGVHGPVVEARRATLRAGIAALEGRSREAVALYKDALSTWRDLKVVWEEAMTGLDMAIVLDPQDADVQAVVRATREILTRLRAKPYLERLETAAARGAPRALPAGRPVQATVAETA
ncbi:MAG TPA: adenylate/guanylate cyclase domain-containing protein [Candidatus Limnocylindria bacterium]|nr:adenylate/guanylate cyclase domain-containing protein [Candidatus Limnocylindria bacterium]